MTGDSRSPKSVKAAIVLIDPENGSIGGATLSARAFGRGPTS